jgi:hypothetical protein
MHALAAMTCGAALVASMAACRGQDNKSTLPTSIGNTPDGATHASANSGTLYVPNYGDGTVSVMAPTARGLPPSPSALSRS